MSETAKPKIEFEFPAEIAWQKEILDALGGEFCRKLQIQIENAVARRYNEGVDNFNRILRENFNAHKNALDALSNSLKEPEFAPQPSKKS